MGGITKGPSRPYASFRHHDLLTSSLGSNIANNSDKINLSNRFSVNGLNNIKRNRSSTILMANNDGLNTISLRSKLTNLRSIIDLSRTLRTIAIRISNVSTGIRRGLSTTVKLRTRNIARNSNRLAITKDMSRVILKPRNATLTRGLTAGSKVKRINRLSSLTLSKQTRRINTDEDESKNQDDSDHKLDLLLRRIGRARAFSPLSWTRHYTRTCDGCDTG